MKEISRAFGKADVDLASNINDFACAKSLVTAQQPFQSAVLLLARFAHTEKFMRNVFFAVATALTSAACDSSLRKQTR